MNEKVRDRFERLQRKATKPMRQLRSSASDDSRGKRRPESASAANGRGSLLAERPADMRKGPRPTATGPATQAGKSLTPRRPAPKR
jgi:hypothetical protein